MIQFTCPCGKPLHAREEYVGQTTRCPQCGRELIIPAEQGVQALTPPPEPAPRDWPDDRPLRRPGPAWAGRPRPPAASGMAIASTILGVLSLFCSLVTAIPAIILGALGLRAIKRSEGRLGGKGLAVTGLVTGGIGLLLFVPALLFIGIPFVQYVREGPNKRLTQENLEQIGIAMQSYQDNWQTFPPAAICDANGKPLLSWRVAILPYIEQEPLYRQFHLNESWDSPHNLPLVSQMPKIYALPGDSTAAVGDTYFRVFVGNGAAFDDPKQQPPPDGAFLPGGDIQTRGVSYSSFTDGTNDTIMVAESATAVPWTKPDEMPYSPTGPLPALGGHFSGGFYVLMADGSYHFVKATIRPATLRALITRNASDFPGPDWYELSK